MSETSADTHPLSALSHPVVYRVVASRLRSRAARKDRETFDLVARVHGFPERDARQIWELISADGASNG